MSQRVRMLIVDLSAVLSSDKGVLGLITVNDLFWQTLADIRWITIQRYAETLGETVVAPALVSVLSGLETEFLVLAMLAQWGFIYAIFFVYTPQVFRRTAENICEDWRFRLPTSTSALGFALIMSSFLLNTPRSLTKTKYVGLFLGIAGISFGGWGWYFWSVQEWPTRSPNEQIDLVDEFVPIVKREREDLLARYASSGVWSNLQSTTNFLAILFICLLFTFFFAWVSVLVLALYPLVEILVLTSVMAGALDRWYRLPFGFGSPNHYTTDIEERLYKSISTAASGLKGWTTLLLLIGFGLFVQVLGFAYVVSFVWHEIVPFLVSAGLAGVNDWVLFTITWNVAGMGFSVLVATVYGVWYWIRMLERLPSYLDFWANKVGKRETEAPESRITRPVGVMVPPSMAIFATLLWMVLDQANSPGLSTLDILYAITWPLLMVGIIVSVWLTRHRDPQLPETDRTAIPLSLVVQLLGGVSAVSWIGNPSNAESPSLVFSPFGAFILIAVPWFFFLQDVYLLGEGYEGVKHYVFPMYLFLFGTIVGILGLAATGWTRLMFLFLGFVLVSSSGLLSLEEYMTPNSPGNR